MIAAAAEIIAIANAQYLPKVIVSKPPKWPAIAPRIVSDTMIPMQNETATEIPFEILPDVLALTIPAIPKPTGNVQGQIAHATMPAPNATKKLIIVPSDNVCPNRSRNS